jgi:hypothetical protein
MVVCRQHTQPTTTPPRNHTTNPTSKLNLVNMSSNTYLPPTYRHMLLRDRPAHAPTADHHNLRSCHAGRPLAPLNYVPQPPPAAQDLGTASEPSHARGLHTPMVLAAPKSTTDLGRAADLSTRTNDPYRCDCPAMSNGEDHSSTPRPLPLAYAGTLVNNALKSTPFPHLSLSQP